MFTTLFYGAGVILIVFAIVNRYNKSKQEKFEDRDN